MCFYDTQNRKIVTSMKARIKRYGQVIDVFPVESRMETDGIHTYYTEAGSEKLTNLWLWKDTELDFNVCELSKQDRSSFRNEVAKEMLTITCGWKLAKGIPISRGAAVKLAIEYADELVKQLMESETK